MHRRDLRLQRSHLRFQPGALDLRRSQLCLGALVLGNSEVGLLDLSFIRWIRGLPDGVPFSVEAVGVAC